VPPNAGEGGLNDSKVKLVAAKGRNWCRNLPPESPSGSAIKKCRSSTQERGGEKKEISMAWSVAFSVVERGRDIPIPANAARKGKQSRLRGELRELGGNEWDGRGRVK